MRIFWHTRSMRGRARPENNEPIPFKLVRLLVALPLFLVVLSYLVEPSRYAFASFPLPDAARWLGAVLFLASIAWSFWVNYSLSTNFSGMLVVYEGHQLIERGPYRYIRHPMYTGFITMMVGVLLLSANWLIGVPPVLIILIVMFYRTPREETMLLQHFGESYRSYMARTGRFLPRLGSART
jgi:protein-S-isoprenylcysteine O-methyltransferase Ste14